jgi:hypothetical protein
LHLRAVALEDRKQVVLAGIAWWIRGYKVENLLLFGREREVLVPKGDLSFKGGPA